jgi:hypothetical protein
MAGDTRRREEAQMAMLVGELLARIGFFHTGADGRSFPHPSRLPILFLSLWRFMTQDVYDTKSGNWSN